MERERTNPLEFFKVDRISDIVYHISSKIVLKFTVAFSKPNKDNKRSYFYNEYEYPARMVDAQTFISIKRNFDYYLSIEASSKDSNGNRAYARIGPSEYFIIKQGLESAIAWFTNKKYSKLFVRDKSGIKLMEPIPDVKITGLPMDKYITIIPTVIDRGVSADDKEPGVRISLNDEIESDVSLERFMGLYYSISTFNMYQCALSIVNFLERPELGTNRVSIEEGHSYSRDKQDSNRNISKVTGFVGRRVVPKNRKQNPDDL